MNRVKLFPSDNFCGAKIKVSNYFAVALFLHILVLAMFCYWNFSHPTVQLGNKKTVIIASYFYPAFPQPNIEPPVIRSEQQLQQVRPLLATKSQTKTEKSIHRYKIIFHAKHSYDRQRSNPSTVNHSKINHLSHVNGSSGEQQTQTLLALLHNAIQHQQQYPPVAMEMGREGDVIIGFTLFTNGNIENLRLLKSSGTSSLDAAALAAVRNATPFQGVKNYLAMNKEFSIDVVFNLS